MASQFVNPNLLSPVITFDTKVPAPNIPFANVGSDPGKLYGDGNLTINLRACSEFSTETVPLNTLYGSHKLRLTHDASGNPMVFTIGQDDKLFCTTHIEGGPVGWKSFDLTPKASSTGKITTFDVLQTIDNRINISVAFLDAQGASSIVWVSIAAPLITWDANTKTTLGFDGLLPWRNIVNSLGSKHVSSITMAPSPKAGLFSIIAGTAADANVIGSHFIINPDPNTGNPWTEVSLPESSAKVVETCPANLWEGLGLYTLYQRMDKSSGLTFDSNDSKFHYRLRTQDIGSARSISANANPWNMTDLLAAGSNGIGFYNFAWPDQPPQLVLPGRAFQQVVCSEKVDTSSPKTQTKLTIFAVSDDDELFFVEGTRFYATNTIEFKASGLPIAFNVANITTQYNGKYSATELMYLGNGTNELFHLYLDTAALMWTAEKILVLEVSGISKFPAYSTSLTFTKSDGTSVGGDYPVLISAPYVHAYVNDRTRIISTAGSTFLTDADGRIKIVVGVDETLAGPSYNVTLTKFTSSPKTFSIDASQRVLRLLGNIKASDDLSKVKSTDGRAVFDSTTKPAALGDTANMLSSFPQMLSTVDSKTATTYLSSPPPVQKDMTIGYSRDENGKVSHDIGDWINDAIDAVEQFLADAIAWFKQKVKAVVKFAIKIVGKALTFVFSIAGKVIRFAIKQVGHLLTGICNFLRDYLGLDMDGFLNWLSFIFDQESTKKTQKMLLDFNNNSRLYTEAYFDTGREVLNTTIAEARAGLSGFIKDKRPNVAPSDSNSIFGKGMSVLGFLLDNPIFSMIKKYNPVKILMEAIMEGAEEGLEESFPNFDLGLKGAFDPFMLLLDRFVTNELQNLVRLLDDAKEKALDAFNDPSHLGQNILDLLGDIVWTIFDAINELILALYDALEATFEVFMNILNANMKLGFISDMWVDFTGTNFSIMNVATYLAATVMNLFTLVTHGKLPVEVFGDPNSIFKVTETAVAPNVKAKTMAVVSTASLQLKPMGVVVAESDSPEDPPKSDPTPTPAPSVKRVEKASITLQTYNNLTGWCGAFIQFSAVISTGSGWFEACMEVEDQMYEESRARANNEQEMQVMRHARGVEDANVGLLQMQNNAFRRNVSWEGLPSLNPIFKKRVSILNYIHAACDLTNILCRALVAGYTDEFLRKDEEFRKTFYYRTQRDWFRGLGCGIAGLDAVVRGGIIGLGVEDKKVKSVADVTNFMVCFINLCEAVQGEIILVQHPELSSNRVLEELYNVSSILSGSGGCVASAGQVAMKWGAKHPVVKVGTGIVNVIDIVGGVVAFAAQAALRAS